MSNRLRSVLPVSVSLTLGLSAAVLMFTLPGDAAPPQLTYAAEATGEVWRVNKLDLDMSGDPVSLDLAVGQAGGVTGADRTPRSTARALNLVGNPVPAGQKAAVSSATGTTDTVGTTTAAGTAGTVPQQVDYKSSTLTARGRWVGDESCIDSTSPLTTSKSVVSGAGVVPATIPEGAAGLPIPLPTEIPTEIPTELPSGFPTELPSDLPTLPIPTELPTISLPTETLPTELPTTLVPIPSVTLSTELPTTLVPLPRSATPAAATDVAMATLNAASVEEKTSLQDWGASGLRKVVAEAIGTIATPSAPAMTFFGGEVELRLTSAPRLTAYSTGTSNGSQVEWTPPQMTLTVAGEPYTVPSDGTALAVQYSKNKDVVLTVSAGRLTAAESATGLLAQAEVTALNILVKNGDAVALDAELFPMAVKAVAPTDGVRCPKDTDGDGLTDDQEAALGTDPNKRDTDRDGLTDGQEVLKYHTKPLKPDTDRDRLKDGVEVKKYRTNPRKADTDKDKLKDGAEVKKYKTNPRKADTDRDKLKDGLEVKKYKTNPRKKDTDGDGVNDNVEIRRGTDPRHK